jgi:subfamily B ATP-binding cassette protein MsbA
MFLKTDFFKNIVRNSKFWRHNYIFLREFKYFWLIALLAIVLSILGAVFEGIAVGIINLFLQSITSTSSSQTGTGWIDTFIIGVQSNPIERLNKLGLLVIVAAFLRSMFSYGATVFALSTEFELLLKLKVWRLNQFNDS